MVHGFRMFFAVLMVGFLSGESFAQFDRMLSELEERKKSVEFEGQRLSIEDFLHNEGAIKKEINRWLKINDPKNRLAVEQHQELFKNNIELMLLGRSEITNIDAFGICAVPAVVSRKRNAISRFVSESKDEVCGPFKYSELPELLLEVKRRLDMIWNEKREAKFQPGLVVRARLVLENSKIRRKPENWLLLELYPNYSEAKEDLFRTDLRKKILASKSRPQEINPNIRDESQVLEMIAPHPAIEEAAFLSKNPEPLEANRNPSSVSVSDDKLTNDERESLYNFEVFDKLKRNEHQVESVELKMKEVGEIDFPLLHCGELLHERVPSGSRLSYNELHLRLGNAVKRFHQKHPGLHVQFSLEDANYEKQKYTKIVVSLSPASQ